MYFKTNRLSLQLSIPFFPLFPFSDGRDGAKHPGSSTQPRLRVQNIHTERTTSIAHAATSAVDTPKKENQKANVRNMAVSGMRNYYVQGTEKLVEFWNDP